MTFAWQIVTCSECGKTYRCTPETDFFHRAADLHDKRADNGLCWTCMVGTDQPEPTPGSQYWPA